MKYLITILVFCGNICLSFGQGCEIEGTYHSSFEDVISILDANNCNSCHAGQNPLGGWNYNSYESFLLEGDCNKTMILHGDASNSYFYQKLGGSAACGESGDNVHGLTPTEFSQIESWINFGAPEHCVPLYNEVKLLLDDNGCNSCHGVDLGLWRYDSYLSMVEFDSGSDCENVKVIVKGDSKGSLLYDKINNDGEVACGNVMDGVSGPMSDYDVALIRDWINSGANETAASLPVILNHFSAIEAYGIVELDWSTEVEVGTEKFVIERSNTGLNFEPISELLSVGSATHGSEYSTLDVNPMIGENYYRLRIIDLDGSYNYSNIRLVRVKSGETSISVYPNPAVSRERIAVEWLPRADEESTYLNIVDVNGQNLHRKIIFEGTNYVRLPYLLDGVYYVIVEDLFGSFLLERIVIIN